MCVTNVFTRLIWASFHMIINSNSNVLYELNSNGYICYFDTGIDGIHLFYAPELGFFCPNSRVSRYECGIHSFQKSTSRICWHTFLLFWHSFCIKTTANTKRALVWIILLYDFAHMHCKEFGVVETSGTDRSRYDDCESSRRYESPHRRCPLHLSAKRGG